MKPNQSVELLLTGVALALMLVRGAVAATLPGGQQIELSADEIAQLNQAPPAWFSEFPDDEEAGRVIYRGDEAIRLDGGAIGAGGQVKPHAFGISGQKWSGGVVYYQFNSNVNNTNRARFRDAAEEWVSTADLTFVESTGNGELHQRGERQWQLILCGHDRRQSSS